MDINKNPDDSYIAAIRSRYPTEKSVDETLTRKMLNRSGNAYQHVDVKDIEKLISDFIQNQAQGYEVSNVKPLGGGASKEQFVFDLVDSKARRSTYVLRREPPESIVETHRKREFQIMRAMQGIVPVPEPVWVDIDGSHFGRPAMISRFVSGVAKEDNAESNVTGLGAGFSEKSQKKLGKKFTEMLAKIHLSKLNPDELDAFEIPEIGSNEGVIKLLNWWDRVWDEDSYFGQPILRLASQWLRHNAPVLDNVTPIHNDFRSSNFLFDPETYEINAILDWELSHFGDYHEDLAWTMQTSYGYYDDQSRFYVCGLIEKEEFLANYQEITGHKIDRDRLTYYGVMNAWKSAIIVLATATRCAIGRKTHQDILLSWITALGPTCIQELNDRLSEVI